MTMDEKIAELEALGDIPTPSPAERAENERKWIERHKPNCISFWFPKLLEIGIPVPRTEIVDLGESLTPWVCGDSMERLDDHIRRITEACDKIGYPCFLRSGQTSAKHSWTDSCWIEGPSVIRDHVTHIAEFCEMCDFFGMPSNVFAARELLPVEPVFHAFYGRMPITREFRFFVKRGEVDHIQPYWPPASIQDPDRDDWRERLAELNAISKSEIARLATLSERIGKHFGGHWSIDWLFSKGEWFCTDMAEGDKSYKWDPSKPDEEGEP